jgi:hypothetical protein
LPSTLHTGSGERRFCPLTILRGFVPAVKKHGWSFMRALGTSWKQHSLQTRIASGLLKMPGFIGCSSELAELFLAASLNPLLVC